MGALAALVGSAMRFSGFYEVVSATPEALPRSVTVRYFETAELLERLRARLESVEPGAYIRVDLIAWEDEL